MCVKVEFAIRVAVEHKGEAFRFPTRIVPRERESVRVCLRTVAGDHIKRSVQSSLPREAEPRMPGYLLGVTPRARARTC